MRRQHPVVTVAMATRRRDQGGEPLGQPWPIRFRRMLGLFAFFYACLHLLTYAWIDQGLDWQGIVEDVIKRPCITLGFAAFVLLVPLALTSTRAMMRLLGRRWQTLHRAVYATAILGVLHYLWLVKADLREPLIYAGILAALLLARLPFARLGVARRWPGIPSAEPQRDRG
jgi:sulfoxide reductase heme-binding subunit YedZ